jgi:hypothetical protein
MKIMLFLTMMISILTMKNKSYTFRLKCLK